jgi:hypothetical protein
MPNYFSLILQLENTLPDIRSKAPVRETVVPAKAGTQWR